MTKAFNLKERSTSSPITCKNCADLSFTHPVHQYLSQHQLKGYSESTIGWIFGIYVFLAFFCGIQIGPIFDARGPRLLILSGSILMCASMMLLGLCTREPLPLPPTTAPR